MRLKLDEHLPAELPDDLRWAGHDVETVANEELIGAADPTLLRTALREGRVLLTLDKAIGDVRRYPPRRSTGVVLFRPMSRGAAAVRQLVLRSAGQLAGRLVGVAPSAIRTRRERAWR